MLEMAIDLRCALDPVAFASERLGFEADPWQAQVLRSPAKLTLLNCSRQSGKSTTTSIIALHTAYFQPESLTLLLSPTSRQSKELFAKVAGFLRMLEPAPILEEDNKLSFEMRNRSRVVSLPGSAETIRGYSAPSLIIEDEAAFVEDGVWMAVRPMLAVSGGRHILMSTPYGKRGHFYETWTGEIDAERIEVPAHKCPRISPEYLAQERQRMGEWWHAQEFDCKFMETADQVFRQADIERAFSDDVEPLFVDGDAGGLKPFFEEN